jgi:uncharacterized surface protein with fasciclin (FAS1) repeats
MQLRSVARSAMLAAITVGAVGASRPVAVPTNIIGSLKAAGKFNTLLSLIETAGMTAKLQTAGPFTIFAPTDSAFAALPPAKLGVLKEKASATALINFYVVPGTVMATEFKTKADAQSYAAFKTMGGGEIKVHMARHVGKEFATLQQTDLQVTNGVIHVVDKVMVP